MKVILMSGIAGSGKSTFVKKMQRESDEDTFLICSADHYFQKNNDGKFDADADYVFDRSKLGKAHGECLHFFTEEIVKNKSHNVIIVDNTNTTSLELAPYVLLSSAYNLPVEIITINCDPHVAAERNTHGVSYTTCSVMAASLNNRIIPAYWNVKITNIDSSDF